MSDKKSLRQKLQKDRLAILPEDWQSRSVAIVERLKSNELVIQSKHIALYQSFRNEVDVSSLMSHFDKKHFYFPKIDDRDGSMEFLRYETNSHLKTHKWGLIEPEQGEKLEDFSDALIIVPALAFDRKGHRLGYGKGYYDRFLSRFSSKTIGVCFSEFFFDSLPSEAHDRVVDIVVTEQGSLNVTNLSSC